MQLLRTIWASRVILASFAACGGAGAVMWVLAGSAEDAGVRAALMSAFATAIAAGVALGLGVEASRRAKNDSEQKAASIATLAAPPLYSLRAKLDVLLQSEEMVKENRYGYAVWLYLTSQDFRNHAALIGDALRSIVIGLPAAELRLLVLADEALRMFQRRNPINETSTLGHVVEQFDKFYEDVLSIRPIVLAASEAIHRLSDSGGPAPWIGAAKRLPQLNQ